MTDQLREVARAHKVALAEDEATKKEVAEAKARRAAALARVDATRGPLAEAIVAEARRGVRQRDILERIESVYTREQVRRICRAADITE